MDKREIIRIAYLKRLGHSFDLTDSDSREFLEFKFSKSLEYKEWKRNESKRNKEWDKEEAIENIEKLSDLLTQVGQNHNVWTKQTGKGFLARIYIPGKAYLNDSGFLVEPYGSIYASQKRKINKATVLFHRWLEKVQNERDEKRERGYLRAIEQWVKSNNHTILAGDIDNLRLAFNSYEKSWGGYSTHSLPTRNAEQTIVAEKEKKERDVPKYVTEKAHYFEDEEDYETSKAWALAWSIYCKYKEPNSPHCERNKRYYLINQGKKDPKKMKPYPKKWQTPANTKKKK